MPPQRGEIWWVELDPTVGSEIAKTRPCVVMTRNVVNQLRRTVVVVPLSSSPSAHPPIRVAIKSSGPNSVAAIDQVRAIAKERLRQRIGTVSSADLVAMSKALREILDLG